MFCLITGNTKHGTFHLDADIEAKRMFNVDSLS